ncbi:hypothetical protein [Clostridium sp. DJ247]|uniref:hypothetical protein n=1 Tax=Clostridium sp. DJ247 TaxID=2726188 RepID=UPI001624B77C|nr:hypothetical protein [Clostridium sp. DJ247]MBC2580914.1 hypothetical protein [Clostridium sp. DJ247]
MDNSGINPIKQNLNIKQYIGWSIALFFPFAIKGVSDVIKLPLLAAVIYWSVFGIFLRHLMSKRLPYFDPKIREVKKEIIILLMITILSVYFHMSTYTQNNLPLRDIVLNSLLFAFLNGCFEQLVWVNILDLAGARIKLNGFIAAFIYVTLINSLFWDQFIPMEHNRVIFFIVSQILLNIVPFIIYIKTEDITIWSIQHIIYNIILVILSEFGPEAFFYGT